MTSSTNYSDINVRPRRYRGIRSSKKSILYSDYNADEDSKNGNLCQRSVSLTALSQNSGGVVPSPGPGATGVPLLEPRMAQLETLEAKMASIEVSLSTTQRRKNGKKSVNGLISTAAKTSTLGRTSPVHIFTSTRSNTLIDTCRELEVLRNALKDKENTIQNLQGQMNCCGKVASLQPLDPSERRSAEIRLQSLKQEEEARKSSIKKINLTLEQIDANEANIDVRIKQAELEYELGREELGLLGVREEMRTLIARLDAKPTPTLYSVVNLPGKYTLHCVHLEYDPKSPRFGAGNLEDKIGLFVLWAADNSGLHKGDRILEVNGKLTLATSKEEMIRLLSVCPSRAEIVVFRPWIPPPSSEDLLRRENLRLTHRISYLEDQVSELLLLKGDSLTLRKETNHCKKTSEVLKGDCLETLKPAADAKKSSSALHLNNCRENDADPSNEKVSVIHAPATGPFVNCYDVPGGTAGKHYGMENLLANSTKLYNMDERRKSPGRKCEKDENASTLTRITRKKGGEGSEGPKTNSGSPTSLKSAFVEEISYSLSDLERPHRKVGHYGRTVDYNSETSWPKYLHQKERKAKSIDDERFFCKESLEMMKSESSHAKPMPPKKPMRLSLGKTGNIQDAESDYSVNNGIRKLRRPQKGEAPQPPIFYEKKVKEESEFILCDSASSRTSSRAESCKTQTDPGQPNFRWVRNSRRNKSRTSEKWC